MDNNEENKPKSYEEVHQEGLKKEQDKRDRMEKVRLDTIEWMKTNPEIQAYLNGFKSSYVENFIDGYAQSKSLFMEYGEFYEDLNERHETRFIEEAEDCLRAIQLKKLFDLRCQWSAELITIPGIIVSPDFWIYANDILNCSFIEPINKRDIELYIDYINSNQYDRYSDIHFFSIENHRSNNEDEEFPAWFEYNNLHTGNNKYLQLPDLRGEKENVYRALWRNERQMQIETKFETGELERPVADDRPTISNYQYHDVLNFMKKFETADAIRKFEANHKHAGMASLGDEEQDDESDYLDERVEEIMLALTAMPDVKIAVEANADWRKALMEGWYKYERTELIKALKPAFSDYLFRKQNNIQFSKHRDDDFDLELSNSVKEQILRGRELNGEPRDFNF